MLKLAQLEDEIMAYYDALAAFYNLRSIPLFKSLSVMQKDMLKTMKPVTCISQKSQMESFVSLVMLCHTFLAAFKDREIKLS